MRHTFKLPPGYTSEDSHGQAQNRWKTGSNVRFWQGLPQSIGGWTRMFDDALSGVPRRMLAFNRSGTATMAYGTSTHLYVGTGAAQPTDRSPTGLPDAIMAWSLEAWGSTLLASPKGGTLYDQAGTSAAEEVVNAPDTINVMLVTPERQVLAGGCEEEISGTFNGLCIRGCDIEDYTDWTTSSSNNAFEHILDGAGQIVAMTMVGAYVAVWTENALHMGRFIGDPGQTYRFDLVDENCGCVGPNAVAVIDGRVWWIRPDLRLMAWAPGELPTAVPSDYHFNPLSALRKDRIVVASNSRYGEVWVFYPLSSLSENMGYFARSIETGAVFGGGVSRTAMLDDGVLTTVLGSAYVSNVIAAGDNGHVYVHETGTTADGSSLHWSIYSGAICEDSFQGRFALRACYPTGWGSPGTFTIFIYPGSNPTEVASADAVAYSVTGAKVDMRVSGRAFSLGFTGTAGGYRLGHPTFDIVPMGER